jgi:hypothetical protein
MAVKTKNRFPESPTSKVAKEITVSRLQPATLRQAHNITHPPHVFTEHGAIMLASVLNSRTAVETSIYVVRAFVEMRTALLEYADLWRRIDQLEALFDDRFQQVFAAIRALLGSPHRPLRPIGFIDAHVQKGKKERP